jgi:hypothetical protein
MQRIVFGIKHDAKRVRDFFSAKKANKIATAA